MRTLHRRSLPFPGWSAVMAHQYELATRPLRQFFSLPLSPAAASEPLPLPAAAPQKSALVKPLQQTTVASSMVVTSSATTAMPKPTTTVAGAFAPATKTPKAREVTPPPPVMVAAPSTPKAVAPGTPTAAQRAQAVTPSGKRGRSEAESPRSKRVRVEWPADLATNAMLKGKSKSQVAEITTQRLQRQQSCDPDLIFRQLNTEFPLSAVFTQFPKAIRVIAAIRGASGDWHDDTSPKPKRSCT